MLSADEKPGVQARSRTRLPPAPRRPTRMDRTALPFVTLTSPASPLARVFEDQAPAVGRSRRLPSSGPRARADRRRTPRASDAESSTRSASHSRGRVGRRFEQRHATSGPGHGKRKSNAGCRTVACSAFPGEGEARDRSTRRVLLVPNLARDSPGPPSSARVCVPAPLVITGACKPSLPSR